MSLNCTSAMPLQSVEAFSECDWDDYQTSQKSLQRLTVRYPASVLDALISVEGFKLDQNHDRAYVENGLNKCAVLWQRFNRACVLSCLETFEKNWQMGKRSRLTCLVSPSMYIIAAQLF